MGKSPWREKGRRRFTLVFLLPEAAFPQVGLVLSCTVERLSRFHLQYRFSKKTVSAEENDAVCKNTYKYKEKKIFGILTSENIVRSVKSL